MSVAKRLSICLWFEDQAEEAAQFYTRIFRNSKITRTTRYSDVGFEQHGRPAGSVMAVEFELDGSGFMALNGGPIFTFKEAVSMVVSCDTQEEIDRYWNELSAGGDQEAQRSGWLKDRFGVSWQIVPSNIDDMFRDESSPGAKRVMTAMLAMKKVDKAELEQAYAGNMTAKKKKTAKKKTPAKKKSAQEPWERPTPKRSSHKSLTPGQKRTAKRAAKKAGRPYPNLVDNMRAAKKAKKKKAS